MGNGGGVLRIGSTVGARCCSGGRNTHRVGGWEARCQGGCGGLDGVDVVMEEYGFHFGVGAEADVDVAEDGFDFGH